MRIRRIVTGCIAGLFLLSLLIAWLPAAYGAEGPVVIDGPGALAAFSDSVSAGQTYAGRTVLLAGDIDMTGRALAPIGRDTPDGGQVFQGVFDGQGHTIQGLAIAGPGLFAALRGAVVKDLHLAVTVSAQGQTAAGGLAGRMTDTTLLNVAVDGTVTAGSWAAAPDGVLAAGVLAGRAEGRTVMDRCAARGSLGAAGAFGARVYVGGAIGYLDGGALTNCYSTAYVFGNDAGLVLGGYAGYLAGSQVTDSYAAGGMVTGANTAGAFAGTTGGSSFNNVWHDGELTAPLTAFGAGAYGGAVTGAPTVQMQSAPFPALLSEAFYQAVPGQNNGYPVLDFEAIIPATPEPVATPEPTVVPEPSDTPGPDPAPSPDPTQDPVYTAAPSDSPGQTPIPTTEPAPVPTDTPVPTMEPSPVPTGTPIPTAEPSPVPTDTPIPKAEPTASPTMTPIPTIKPAPFPTDTPAPTPEPTASPTSTPILTDTQTPIPTGTPVPAAETPSVPTETPPASTMAPGAPIPAADGPTGPAQPPTGGQTAPRTGDETDVLRWLALAVTLAGLLAVTTEMYRKR